METLISLKIRDSYERYQLQEPISSGSFGRVYRAKDLKDINLKEVAFKQQDLSAIKSLYEGDRIKICDFGIASFGTSTLMKAGKELYMAPEAMFGSFKYNLKVDIWSLGILIYYLCTGSEKMNGTAVNLLALQNKDINLPQEYQQLQSLMKKMLILSPEERPDSSDLKQEFYSLIKDKLIFGNQKNQSDKGFGRRKEIEEEKLEFSVENKQNDRIIDDFIDQDFSSFQKEISKEIEDCIDDEKYDTSMTSYDYKQLDKKLDKQQLMINEDNNKQNEQFYRYITGNSAPIAESLEQILINDQFEIQQFSHRSNVIHEKNKQMRKILAKKLLKVISKQTNQE
ncbi:protein kinase superfamily protein [Stylonychia lemnae]|uniref:non-specific serine/threonine protein kinase n=1 Tax=Stylonychia lemnae TaxID=5949 RepID=A0A078AC10_STYLE|nr:protein kinase superfamily protein [Stylonychia lemnae]|eukprot:CDW78318.1 protein kinase superfamily protein [Stylonychia lemnae]